MIKHALDSGVITIKKNESLDFYKYILRTVFESDKFEIKLEALESAICKLIMVAQLLECSGMAIKKKTKTEVKHVPLQDAQTGEDLDKYKPMIHLKITLIITEKYKSELRNSKLAKCNEF